MYCSKLDQVPLLSLAQNAQAIMWTFFYFISWVIMNSIKLRIIVQNIYTGISIVELLEIVVFYMYTHDCIVNITEIPLFLVMIGL